MYGPFITRTRNVDTAWRTIVNTVLDKGTTVYTEKKKQKTLECISAVVHVTDWRSGSVTPQNYIGLSPQIIEQQYWPQYSSSERGEHTYTYGWCMKKRFGFNQIQYVVDTLKKGERTAFAQFWNPIVDSKSPDPPCINIVAFQKSKGRINLIEYIRSNDIGRAWSEDVSGSYAVFLTEVAANFGGTSARGDIVTVMGSAHIYETAIEEIKERFRSSYSSSNPKPTENTSALFGPVLGEVKEGGKCSTVVREIAERYSRILGDDKTSPCICLSVHPTEQWELNGKSSVNSEDAGELGRALEYHEGKNDEGEPETINQVAWASSKAGSSPESRRIVLTPNDPAKHEYSINPVIIQFLIREKTIYTVSLYHDVKVDDIDRNMEELLAVVQRVRGGKRGLRFGPLAMMLAPVTL